MTTNQNQTGSTTHKYVCGEDFCEKCGDCMSCYPYDPCYDGGDHFWCPREEVEQNE
jgi:hypothetical protein